MPLYECHACNFSSIIKSHYHRHLKTKKHAKRVNELKENDTIEKKGIKMTINDHKMTINDHKMTINDHKMTTKLHKKYKNPEKNSENPEKIVNTGNIDNIENTVNKKKKYECVSCGARFSTRPHMRRHELHHCKSKKPLVDKKIIELEKMHQQEKKQLYDKIEKLIEKVGNTTTNITNNTQNIILNNYGSEDLSHITDLIKTQLIKIPYSMIPKMIEAVHFNDNKPENKNIVLPNKNENKLKVYSGNKWVYKNKDEAINDLVDCKYTLLDKHFDSITKNNNQHFSPFIKTNYLKFRKYYDEGDTELIEQLKKECDLVFLNNR